MQDLEDFIVLSYNLQAVLENKYTDEEIRAKYEEIRKEDENAFLRATVRHVLVSLTDAEGNERTEQEALKRAQEAQVKLKNGGDWTTIAKEYSDDPGSSQNGGKYEDYPVSGWVDEFKQHAIEQPIGEVGEPFLTAYGYHVMVVEDRRQPDFEEVKEQVRNGMIDEYYTNMVEVEVPKLVTEINLPAEEQETTDGTGEGNAEAAE
jgi:foldase protein PrsA